MIFVGNMREVRRGEYDAAYACVRSMRRPSDWMVQLPELSPSQDLFYKYLGTRDKGEWNAGTFRDMYLPQFLREFKQDKASRDALNRVYTDSKAGKRIALLCFCPDEKLCHRSILAGLLQGAGADVRLRSGADFSGYYRQYLALDAKAPKGMERKGPLYVPRQAARGRDVSDLPDVPGADGVPAYDGPGLG